MGDPAHRDTARPVTVRAVTDADHTAVVAIARRLVDADTYAFDPTIGDDELWSYFAPAEPGRGFVAADQSDTVVGVFVLRPNQPGPGAHVANGSYAVAPEARGRGVGRRMAERSIEIAAELGYLAMQFNTVVSTNEVALRLWRSLGFTVIGTVPDGFRLRDGTFVDHHVMHRALSDGRPAGPSR